LDVAKTEETVLDLDLSSLTTPCLLLEEAKLHRNIDRLRTRLSSVGVQLRPHLKTVKSARIARLLISGETGPAAVSTLREAEYFSDCGIRDLLYAVALSVPKLERALALRARGVELSVVADNLEMARTIADRSRRVGCRIPVLIELDCDGRRGGIDPHDSDALLATARALSTGGAELRGVMVHAGQSYAARSIAEIEEIAELERRVAVQSAQTLRAAGLPCPLVSVGSTPTALFGRSFTGVTEVRAGVYAFFDLVMAGLKVCQASDIALSVLATVIDIKADERRAVIDAGWMSLSRDRGTAAQDVDCGYGIVCAPDGTVYPDLLVTEVNQEHGIIRPRPGSSARVDRLRVGDLVRILPNHACATASQHDCYHVLTGTPARVRSVWPRIRGW
jgi:D-serine deaminase-like pyridoxal phosphate-dependent protein